MILLLATALLTSAYAAPCCGGSSALPSLLTGDDRAQVQTSASFGSVIGDAPAAGIPVFRAVGDNEHTVITRLEGAYRWFEHFQTGFSLPAVGRIRAVNQQTHAAWGLGDVQISAAYEVLPEWDYSVWRPKGFLFAQMTFPSGSSTYDARQAYQLDSRGRGFYSAGIGTALLKTWSEWDAFFNLELHRSFDRGARLEDGTQISLQPGWGGTATLGGGWSPGSGSLRVGVSLSPVWEEGIDVTGDVNSRGTDQWVWNLGLQAHYLISDEWTVGAQYTDQTLLGPAQNVSLNRTLGLTVMKRWNL